MRRQMEIKRPRRASISSCAAAAAARRMRREYLRGRAGSSALSPTPLLPNM